MPDPLTKEQIELLRRLPDEDERQWVVPAVADEANFRFMAATPLELTTGGYPAGARTRAATVLLATLAAERERIAKQLREIVSVAETTAYAGNPLKLVIPPLQEMIESLGAARQLLDGEGGA